MKIAFLLALTPWLLRGEGSLNIPDVGVVNQDGEKVSFYSGLVKDKVVAINTIFTTCTTICPAMGASFGRLQKALGERAGRDVHLISISVDPGTDTPQRLKAWSQQFHAGPGWTLVTGAKPNIDRLLKALNVYTVDKLDHTPTLLLGNAATGSWTRASALAPPEKLIEALDGLAPSRAQIYFTDVPLTDQDGKEHRLYTDLMKGRVVVIDVLFTACQDSCPRMAATFARVQEALGDRLGKDAYLLSISVDPENDTTEKLKAYAERFHARPGWFFLSGKKENVEAALKKFGQYVESRDQHLNIFLIGNERTGLWKKAFGLAGPEEVIRIVESVLNDKG